MAISAADDTKNLSKSSINCSLQLAHLVGADTDETQSNAKEVYKSILALAGPIGWAANLESPSVFDVSSKEWARNTIYPLKLISFTGSTLAGLKAHRDIYGAQYGLAFDGSFLLSKGAKPCLNIRQSLLQTEIESGML